MSYQISIKPSSSNSNQSQTQSDAIALLKTKYPYASYVKSSTGLWTVTIPDAPVIAPPPPPSSIIFSDSMDGIDGLLTNEWAYWNAGNSKSVVSTNWEMTSGSLFRKNNQGWSGVPNDNFVDADPLSQQWNDSAIFRLNSKRKDFGNFAVSLSLTNNGYVSTPSTPSVAWDGIHIFLRYQSEYQLYYASVNRRDNTCVVKKKVPGGTSNGGTYYEISPYVPFTVLFGAPQIIGSTIKTNADGSVTISITNGGKLILQATDNGIGGAPITAPGATGIRGDNCNFLFDNFTVNSL